MLRRIAIAFVIGICASSSVYANQARLLVKPGNLPDKPAGELLPGQPAAHVQINSIGLLLKDLNELVMSMVPRKAVPTDLTPLLDTPNPTVSYLTMMAMGTVMSEQQLADLFGLDLNRPVSWSLYLGQWSTAAIVAIPVTNHMSVSGLINNVLRPTAVEEQEVSGVTYYHVTSGNQNLPKQMTIACSASWVYMCTSMSIAELLLREDDGKTLAQNDFYMDQLAAHKEANLVCVMNAKPIMVVQAQLSRIEHMLRRQFLSMRNDISLKLSPKDRRNVNMQLRSRLGVRDVDQFVDYVECFTLGSFYAVQKSANHQAESLWGVTISLDLTGADQTVRLAIHSDDIDPAESPSTVDIASVKQALAQMPGLSNSFVATGKHPRPRPAQFAKRWFDAVDHQLTEMGLSKVAFDAIRRAIESHHPPRQVEELVDWKVSSTRMPVMDKDPNQFNSVSDYWEYLTQFWLENNTRTDLVAVPRMKDGAYEQMLVSNTQMKNQNEQRLVTLKSTLNFRASSFERSHWVRKNELQDGLKLYIIENSWRTKFGLFGYNQHELVNRRYSLYRDLDNITLLHEGAMQTGLILSAQSGKPNPLPLAIVRLLDEAPQGTHTIEVSRHLHLLVELVGYLGKVEGLIHREMEATVTRINQILQGEGTADEKHQKLLDLELPISFSALRVDAQTGQLYVTMPFFLEYPRKRSVAGAYWYIREFAENAPKYGGAAVFHRTVPGTHEWIFVQNTELLALLVRTVVDKIYERYILPENGMEQLRIHFVAPHDGQRPEDQTVIYNAMWEPFNNSATELIDKVIP